MVAVFKSHLNFRQFNASLLYDSFEVCLFDLGSSSSFTGLLMYRPPKFKAKFLADFFELLSTVLPRYKYVLILSDFNIHVFCPDKPLLKDIFNILDSFDLVQWVPGPTHDHGHTLDLVLSFGLSVKSMDIVKPAFSDHSAVLFDIVWPFNSAPNPAPVRWFRGLDKLTVAAFSAIFSLEWPSLYSSQITSDSFLLHFDQLCMAILDEISPFSCRKSWFSEEIQTLRRDCRKAERRWKKDGLQISHCLLRDKLYLYNEVVRNAKRKFYSEIISSVSGDQRTLFQTLGALIDSDGSVTLMESSVENCEKFCAFFMDILSIRSCLTQHPGYIPPNPIRPEAKFESFSLVTLAELERVVSRLKPAGSSCDVLPACFFSESFSFDSSSGLNHHKH